MDHTGTFSPIAMLATGIAERLSGHRDPVLHVSGPRRRRNASRS